MWRLFSFKDMDKEIKGLNTLRSSIGTICGDSTKIPSTRSEGYEGELLELEFMDLRVGTVFRLQPLIMSLPELDEELLSDDAEKLECAMIKSKLNFKGNQLKLIEEHKATIIEILCVALWNKKGDYPQEYTDFFLWNIDSLKDLYVLLRIVISKMHAENFIFSTTMMRRVVALIENKEMALGSIRCS